MRGERTRAFPFFGENAENDYAREPSYRHRCAWILSFSRLRLWARGLDAFWCNCRRTLDFGIAIANSFFAALRERYDGEVAVEPRHPTWFEPVSSLLLERYRCTRVAVDPACVPSAAEPGGWTGFEYWRLHGFPRVYASSYDDPYLEAMVARLRGPNAQASPHGASSTTQCLGQRLSPQLRYRSACAIAC
jgi:Protein of unknown function DUF72